MFEILLVFGGLGFRVDFKNCPCVIREGETLGAPPRGDAARSGLRGREAGDAGPGLAPRPGLPSLRRAARTEAGRTSRGGRDEGPALSCTVYLFYSRLDGNFKLPTF